jgi:hypothetical protein
LCCGGYAPARPMRFSSSVLKFEHLWGRMRLRPMQVAVRMEFKAERREPLGVLIRRIATQFERAGVQPTIIASFNDGPGGITTSAVDRALKKYPQLAPFERDDALSPRLAPIHRLTNRGVPHPFGMRDVLALADGVPRSLPFHGVTVHLGHDDFGQAGASASRTAPEPGITIHDSWWVNGRKRALFALYWVDADPASRSLPAPPDSIHAILEALGKPRRTAQFVARSSDTTASTEAGASAVASDTAAIVAKYGSSMQSLIERLGLPHDLLPQNEARQMNLGGSGPLRPALVRAFASRGYDCHGATGTFMLQRRTAENHAVELVLDVGTWSRSVLAMFRVRGPGSSATLHVPVSTRAQGGQYPIGDVKNWERIVENLAMIVDELERTFVKEVEAAVGRAPEWFSPGRR